MTREATVVVETRSGRQYTVENARVDTYRVPQMQAADWVKAGTLFCYLGVANPIGMFAETVDVRIVEIK